MDALKQIEYFLETFEIGSVYHDATLNILRNLPRIKNMSIVQVADMCCVSQSTVSKLIKRLGFSDFGTFKIAVAESLVMHESGAYDIRIDIGNVKQVETTYLDQFKTNVLQILQVQDFDIFVQAAKALHERSRVAFNSYTIYPSSCFISEMLMGGKHINIIKTPQAEHAYAESAGDHDIMVAFIGGNSDWPLKQIPMEKIRSRGGKIIAISHDLDFKYGDSVDFLLKYDDLDGSVDGFFRDFYLRVLLWQYKSLRRSMK